MKNIVFVILIFWLPFLLSAQSLRTVVVEHFTNTRCSICASRNPAFYQTLDAYPQVLHIAFHPSAPYSACLFSQQNKVENDERTQYYNAYGSTPKVVVQGTLIPSSNPSITGTTLDTLLNKTSVVEISAYEEMVGADSMRVTIVVRTTGANAPSSARLFAGVSEDPVLYNAPNGENVHHDVFRKALTAVTGNEILLAAISDSVVFELGYKVAAGWSVTNLSTLALVQLSDTKEILNACRSQRIGMPLSTPELSHSVLNVFPNPTNDQVRLAGYETRVAQYEIFNMEGRLVMNGRLDDSFTDIETTTLVTGIYIIKVGNVNTRFAKYK